MSIHRCSIQSDNHLPINSILFYNQQHAKSIATIHLQFDIVLHVSSYELNFILHEMYVSPDFELHIDRISTIFQ